MSKQRGRLYRFFIGAPPSQEIKDRVLRKKQVALLQPRPRERSLWRVIGQGLPAIIGGNVLANAGVNELRAYFPEMTFFVGMALYGVLFCLLAWGIWMILDRIIGKRSSP